MRSRYSAYAVGHDDYVFRTWHPRTRPPEVHAASDGPSWLGLEILDTTDGGPDDETGEVEFRAHSQESGRTRVLHERSRFTRRGGRWVYVDGETS